MSYSLSCSQPNSDVVIGAADAGGSFVTDRLERLMLSKFTALGFLRNPRHGSDAKP